ncbi:MAG: ferritin family protein [Candidatus Aminicenantia bacterium]
MEFSSIKEIIEYAKEKEEEARYYYTEAAKYTDNQDIKELFEKLAKEEENHKKVLEELKIDEIGKKVEGISLPKLKSEDIRVGMKYSPQMSPKELLEFAIEEEKKAYYLYTELEEISETKKLRDLFRFLAMQEADHRAKLEDELANLKE